MDGYIKKSIIMVKNECNFEIGTINYPRYVWMTHPWMLSLRFCVFGDIEKHEHKMH